MSITRTTYTCKKCGWTSGCLEDHDYDEESMRKEIRDHSDFCKVVNS